MVLWDNRVLLDLEARLLHKSLDTSKLLQEELRSISNRRHPVVFTEQLLHPLVLLVIVQPPLRLRRLRQLLPFRHLECRMPCPTILLSFTVSSPTKQWDSLMEASLATDMGTEHNLVPREDFMASKSWDRVEDTRRTTINLLKDETTLPREEIATVTVAINTRTSSILSNTEDTDTVVNPWVVTTTLIKLAVDTVMVLQRMLMDTACLNSKVVATMKARKVVDSSNSTSNLVVVAVVDTISSNSSRILPF